MEIRGEMSPEALKEQLREEVTNLEKQFIVADANGDTKTMDELNEKMRLLQEQLGEMDQQEAA